MLCSHESNSTLCRTQHRWQKLACHKVGHVVVHAAGQPKSALDEPLQHSNGLMMLY